MYLPVLLWNLREGLMSSLNVNLISVEEFVNILIDSALQKQINI
jgi:hypothetical protein